MPARRTAYARHPIRRPLPTVLTPYHVSLYGRSYGVTYWHKRFPHWAIKVRAR